MGPTSTWDYFTLSVLLLAIAALVALRERRWKFLKRPLILLVISYALFSPFYLLFTRKMMPIGIGLVGDLMTDFGAAWTAMGLFLAGVVAVQWTVWTEILRHRSRIWSWIPLLVVAAVTITLWLCWDRFPATYLLYSLLASPFLFLFFSRRPKPPFVGAYLLAGFALFILSMCEIFIIKDFLQGGEWKRMNTVFKFYYQAWFLFALALPALVATALRRIRPAWGRSLVAGIAGLALTAALIWTPMAVANRIRDRPFQHPSLRPFPRDRTFDGLNWLRHLRPHEYKTAGWLWKNAKAEDVLLEASFEDYRYDYNVVSAASGVPTVLSWWSHADQRDRRSGERRPLIQEAYQTPDGRRALRILRQLSVRYVYVGERERERYGNDGLAKFAERPDLFTPVLSFPEATLYRVNR